METYCTILLNIAIRAIHFFLLLLLLVTTTMFSCLEQRNESKGDPVLGIVMHTFIFRSSLPRVWICGCSPLTFFAHPVQLPQQPDSSNHIVWNDSLLCTAIATNVMIEPQQTQPQWRFLNIKSSWKTGVIAFSNYPPPAEKQAGHYD